VGELKIIYFSLLSDERIDTGRRFEVRSPEETRFSAPYQSGPGDHPAPCKTNTGSFSGLKWPGLGVDHPLPSSTEVKERVKLYLYFLSMLSRQAIG
jgi:hypothetical protein